MTWTIFGKLLGLAGDWFAGWLTRRHAQEETARANAETRQVETDAQDIQNREARDHVDAQVQKLEQPDGVQSSTDAPADSAAGRMRDAGWTR